MQSSETKLTGEQKQSIGLLSIGTFLEYFDLMLYVHMAILLNELFFPKTDPFTLSLISAIAFCSSYVLRPLGALIFGYIGDHIGRKHTVVITTLLMSISCVVMANLPTYEQIGITAAWLVTICRMIQGISSIGEITGSQLYLTEITTPPMQYPVVALVLLASSVGSVTALGVASLCSAYGFNWRIAFWIGAGIALVGSYARSALRETPEFVNAKLRLKRIFEEAGKNPQLFKNNYIIKEKVNKKVVLSLFLIDCALPVFFYLTYIHFGNFLKNTFNYSGSEVIYHNFKVGLIYLTCAIIQTYLSYKIHPLKILRTRMQIFAIFILLYPYLLGNISTPFHLLIFQACIIVFAPSNFPAVSVFFKHIPIFKRFTYSSVLHAVSHALIYVITSFGLIYLVKQFGQTGVLIIIIPICVGFIYGIRYFKKLEKETGNYPQKGKSLVSSNEGELA